MLTEVLVCLKCNQNVCIVSTLKPEYGIGW